MAGQNVITLNGTLLAGPARSTSVGFPSGVANATFSLKPSNKAAAVMTGPTVRNLNSASSYATLDGVGPNQSVTNGNFLYLRTESDMLIRVTFDDGSGGNVVSVFPVSGLFILETKQSQFVKLLEAQGVGVIELFMSGNL